MNKILITGANGFLGKYLRKVFEKDIVITLGKTNCELNTNLALSIPIFNEPIDTVIHAAGKAHVVPKNKKEAQEFIDNNVIGTNNLLSGLENLEQLPKNFIFISSVSVYGKDSGENIDETYELDGKTVYAQSKIQAEKIIEKWGSENEVTILILRLPLLVGKNPPGNLGKMMGAINKNYYFRMSEVEVKKSMVLAEDVALFIKQNIGKCGVYNLTDGYHPSIKSIEDLMAAKLNVKIKKLPVFLVRFIAKMGDLIPFFPLNTDKLHKLSQPLTFNDDKARRVLGWNPRKVIDHFEL